MQSVVAHFLLKTEMEKAKRKTGAKLCFAGERLFAKLCFAAKMQI